MFRNNHVVFLLFVLGALFALNAAAETNAKDNQDTTVLVAGATGRTGRLLVAQLLGQQYAVRGFVRDPEKAAKILDSKVMTVVGDVKRPESIAPAMEGVRYVIAAIGSGGDWFGPNGPEFVDYGGVKNLVEGAKGAGVEHFVLISSKGVNQKDHPLNKRFNNVLQWKLKGENALRTSGIPYTIVRPGGLRDDPGGKHGITVTQSDLVTPPPNEVHMIPRADVASVCIEALGRADARNRTLEIVSDPQSDGVNWNVFFSQLEMDK